MPTPNHQKFPFSRTFGMFAMALLVGLAACAPDSSQLQDGPRAARVSSQGANDPRERLRDELGEFMVSFDRTLSRLETTAARQVIDDPEALQAIFTRRDLIEQAFAQAYSKPDPFVALVELWYDAYRLNAWNRNRDEESSVLGKGGAAQRILDRIRNIARRWIQPNIFDELELHSEWIQVKLYFNICTKFRVIHVQPVRLLRK